MDSYFDDSWCPSCGRQILPKRLQVPLSDSPAPSPAPPPSSPQSSPTKNATKKPTKKVRGGLVHGTGRVKPNGAITTTPPPPPPPASANNKSRTRTIIDPAPLPLYCSDECRVLDSYYSSDARPPTRGNTVIAPSSSSSSSPISPSLSHGQQTHISPSIATLAAIYNFPPLPPLDFSSPLSSTSSSSSSSPRSPSSSSDLDEYTFPDPPKPHPTTVKRTLQSIFPPKPKKSTYERHLPVYEDHAPNKVIPGWTDGSQAWRATVYNLTDHDPSDLCAREEVQRIYASHHSTPLRSKAAVYSTLGTKDIKAVEREVCTESAPKRSLEDEELLYGYHAAFARKASSRKAVGGTQRNSSQSLSTQVTKNGASEIPGIKRPVVETRSWSYDNFHTLYAPMKMPNNEGKKLFLFPEKEVVVRR